MINRMFLGWCLGETFSVSPEPEEKLAASIVKVRSAALVTTARMLVMR